MNKPIAAFHRQELQTLAWIRKLRVNYRAKIVVAFLVGLAIGVLIPRDTPEHEHYDNLEER